MEHVEKARDCAVARTPLERQQLLDRRGLLAAASALGALRAIGRDLLVSPHVHSINSAYAARKVRCEGVHAFAAV